MKQIVGNNCKKVKMYVCTNMLFNYKLINEIYNYNFFRKKDGRGK